MPVHILQIEMRIAESDWDRSHKGKGVVKGSVKGIDTFECGDQAVGMVRKLRVEYPGAIYHVMNRGDRQTTNPT